jgi:hypothetical protein
MSNYPAGAEHDKSAPYNECDKDDILVFNHKFLKKGIDVYVIGNTSDQVEIESRALHHIDLESGYVLAFDVTGQCYNLVGILD